MSLYPEPLPLGSCALCGAEVYAGEPFPKLAPNHYICQTCDAHRCTVCGNPEAIESEGEWICLFCLEWHCRVLAEREAEYWSHAGWKDVFGDEK